MVAMKDDILPRLRRLRWGIAMLVLVCALAFLPGQCSIPPIDRDEARFAQASKQMLEDGDIVTPRFQNELRAKKPAGIYWLQSLSAAALGADSMASYRLPSLIGGVLVCFIGLWLARQLLSQPQAVAASLMMASSLVLVTESHLAKTDAMLAAVTLIQQAFLWQILAADRSKHHVSGWLALGFWASMACGILIKGPVTPLIAIMTALTVCIGQKRWKWLSELRPTLGFITLAVIVLPWVILVTNATNGVFLSTAIKTDLVSKLHQGQESHGAPPLTHVMLVMVTFWPGSLFLARAARNLGGRWRDTETLFLLGWVVPFWLIIEITATKLPHYMLPVMPAMAMLAAYGISAALPSSKRPAKTEDQSHPRRPTLSTLVTRLWEILFILATLALGVIVLSAATFYGGDRLWAMIAVALSLGIATLAVMWIRQAALALLALIFLLAAIFHGITFGLVIPSLADIHLAPRLKAAIESLDPKPQIIAAAGYHEPSMVFALGTETLLFTPEDAAIFLSEAPNGIALVESRSKDEFLRTLDANGRKAESILTVKGYNISRGQRVSIEMFRPSD